MPTARSDRQAKGLLVIAAAGALVTALCILALDAPVARALAPYEPWPLWSELLWGLEVVSGLTLSRWTYAFALPAAGLLALLVPRLRPLAFPLWLLAVVHVATKFTTVELKEFTGRLRPSEWLTRGGDMFFVDGGIAFPSGHVTHLLSLTLPLAVVAPRLGRPLMFLPLLISICRVAVNAHFLSDVTGALVWVCVVTCAAFWVLRRIEARFS